MVKDSVLKDNKALFKKLVPLLLTIAVIAADQITKHLIVQNVPPYTVGAGFFGDLVRIIHVHNPGVAFSIGVGLSHAVRRVVFAFLPLAVLILILVLYFRSNDFTTLQRWGICGIVGGGFGNLIDRFFRAEGVIDFIDVKFFGILGYDRWPTFNVADMSVVICGILLLISFFAAGAKTKREGAKTEPGEDA